MSNAMIGALQKLLAQPSGLPSSALTPAQRHALDSLAAKTGALRAAPSGRGVLYHVVHLHTLEAQLKALRPQSEASLPEHLPRRAANIALTRHSKGKAHAHDVYYLLLKAAGTNVGWHDAEGRAFNLSDLSATTGVGALATRANDGWHTDCPLWLVENQALFDRLDWLPAGVNASVAYYAGQLDGRLLAWLAAKARAPELVLFPDYDGVGLLNYVQLKTQSLAPARFWLMQGWRDLLRDYGNAGVWQATRPQFETALQRLQGLDDDAELQSLMTAMRQSGLALEHEAVWLHPAFSR